MVVSSLDPPGAVASASRAGNAFQEAAVREVTRLHEARESPWWVEAVGVPVPVASGFEVVDVVLRSPGALMALQCLRMTPLRTFHFQQRPGLAADGNLFTVAQEIRAATRGDSSGECPTLLTATARSLRGAAGLADQGRPSRTPTPAGGLSNRVIPAVLTTARLVSGPSPLMPESRYRTDHVNATSTERFWVWLLACIPADPHRQKERRPVAIVTWTGLRHFLGAVALERHGPQPA